MFAEQRRLGDRSGAARPEVVEKGEAVRERPRRFRVGGNLWSEPAIQDRQRRWKNARNASRRSVPPRRRRRRARPHRFPHSRQRAEIAAPNRWFLRSSFRSSKCGSWYALRWRRLASCARVRGNAPPNGPQHCSASQAHDVGALRWRTAPPNSCFRTWNCSSSTRRNCREREVQDAQRSGADRRCRLPQAKTAARLYPAILSRKLLPSTRESRGNQETAAFPAQSRKGLAQFARPFCSNF